MTYDPDLEHRYLTRLRLARETLGWSQQHLADRADMHRATISKIENGTRGITLTDGVALAQALGVPLDDMIRTGHVTFARVEPDVLRVWWWT